jgi:hypothetical protein
VRPRDDAEKGGAMKVVVCTLTVRLPMASMLVEGMTEETVRAEFEGVKNVMSETAPDGCEFSLSVTTEE